jgi:hypothetical protein
MGYYLRREGGGVQKESRHPWSAPAAKGADLGEFRHGHRLRNAPPQNAISWIGGAGLLTVIILALNGQWLAILIITVLAVPIVPCWMYLPAFAPYWDSTLTDPSRVAVYERGLVLDGGREPHRAVRWEAITGVGTAVVGSPSPNAYRAAYQWPGTFSASFTIGGLTGRRALLASVRQRAAVPPRYWPRAAWAAAGAAVIALYVVLLVVPEFAPPLLPMDSSQLQAACQGGVSYRNAAPYTEGGSHPVIVFSNDPTVTFSAQWAPDDPTTIQLVACVQADGNTSDSSVTCSYNKYGMDPNGILGNLAGPTETDNVTWVEYQITVYTLRTHQQLGSVKVNGADTTCPQQKEPGAPINSQLTDDQLHQVLDPYVNRSA